MIKTAESVTEGHPDKVCDQVADAILDAMMLQDPSAAVAVEVMSGVGFLMIAGEVTMKGWVDIQAIARAVGAGIGYTNPDYCF